MRHRVRHEAHEQLSRKYPGTARVPRAILETRAPADETSALSGSTPHIFMHLGAPQVHGLCPSEEFHFVLEDFKYAN